MLGGGSKNRPEIPFRWDYTGCVRQARASSWHSFFKTLYRVKNDRLENLSHEAKTVSADPAIIDTALQIS